jgi:hypothetical protein
LRVWLPGLANPDVRDREVIYVARESRKVSEWQIALPERCWECDATSDLSPTELGGTVRSFEYALHIFVGGLATSLVLALFWLWIQSWFTALLALAALVATFGLLWLKSWQESIRVAVWSCPEHKSPMPELEMVVDDAELHLYLPNRRIAEHARESLKKSRRSRGAYDTDAGPGAAVRSHPSSVDDEISSLPLSTNVPGTGRYVSPHGPTGPSVPDLPPIAVDDGPLLANPDQTGRDTPAAKRAADAGSADPIGPAS